ncbi:MAG TPA: phosphoglycerate kinase [Candidatus Latescibacteria bacterium]|nr:phosphoglycerate kinase [Candidatus Latescibacterota bacterium]
MAALTLRDIDVRGKRVLVREDYNVPLDENQNITDETRIQATLETVRWIIDRGGKLILMAHLGRPKGKPDPKQSLAPVAKRLAEILGKPVVLAPDCVGEETEAVVGRMKDGDVVLLENLRFHKEEEANDPEFAAKLAKLGDVYVNDAFGTAHRAHASTVGVTAHFKQNAAGFLMEKELKYLGEALEKPARPFVAIMGGSKISGKIDVINNLLPKVDALLIGGGMAYTFYKAMGLEIGKSLLEADKIDLARELLSKAGRKIVLPVDTVIADAFDNNATTKVAKRDEIPAGWEGVDIGPATVKEFGDIIKSAKTIVWNGPLGVFEMPNFAKGTAAIAHAVAEATDKGSISVIGGGDSAAAITQAGLAERMSHISTGGGASLEYLEGKVLPGVAALTQK